MLTIVDYGMGNLASIQNMFRYIGVASEISNNPERIRNADKLVLPGVGAFDTAMANIRLSGLKDILDQKALGEKIPVLGICLGMQLMTNGSEEGKQPGLGWISAETKKFPFLSGSGLKVPHMGWNNVIQTKQSSHMADFDSTSKFYFVHSYYVKAQHEVNVMLKTSHGFQFDAMITNNENVFGVQFHPEKSHKHGMKLLDWFSRI